jgi:hypothetical protein
MLVRRLAYGRRLVVLLRLASVRLGVAMRRPQWADDSER